MSSKKKVDQKLSRRARIRSPISDATVRAPASDLSRRYTDFRAGSVQLVLLSGKVARSDKRIGRLIADWEH
jgi:hypothetical protein